MYWQSKRPPGCWADCHGWRELQSGLWGEEKDLPGEQHYKLVTKIITMLSVCVSVSRPWCRVRCCLSWRRWSSTNWSQREGRSLGRPGGSGYRWLGAGGGRGSGRTHAPFSPGVGSEIGVMVLTWPSMDKPFTQFITVGTGPLCRHWDRRGERVALSSPHGLLVSPRFHILLL